MDLTFMGRNAKAAARVIACADAELKNRVLFGIADALDANAEGIIAANKIDLENGEKNGLSAALLDRLMLDDKRIADIANAVRDIARQDDPVGKILDEFARPNGLLIKKVTVPLGVIGIIYESRPNVTADAAAICLKSGNVVILRGGKEAIHSNTAIADVMRAAAEESGLPADCIQLVSDTSRESATALMGLTGYLDVLIPRGGAGLIRSVVENAKVPVIETGSGNCHVYIDKAADMDMAVDITFFAKTSRVSVCNSCETLLVHKNIADEFLPLVVKKLSEKNVEICGCERTAAILGGCTPASEEDYYKEYNDYILSVKVVNSVQEAADHIAKYSTGHSEAIVTNDEEAADFFCLHVDSAAVYVNASTRFTDGGEFGFGAEIGISTQKIHARGPMGTDQLVSYKYVVYGTGQLR